MNVQKGSVFANSQVLLDDNDYRDCIFNNCKLVFRGEKPTALNGCKFDKCKFVFSGPAELTINFLKELAKPTSGFSEVIKQSLPELFTSS